MFRCPHVPAATAGTGADVVADVVADVGADVVADVGAAVGVVGRGAGAVVVRARRAALMARWASTLLTGAG
jgi:hypothetical protein